MRGVAELLGVTLQFLKQQLDFTVKIGVVALAIRMNLPSWEREREVKNSAYDLPEEMDGVRRERRPWKYGGWLVG